LADSGVLASAVVKGAGTAVANNVPYYVDTTGRLLNDSGLPYTKLVSSQMTSTTNGNLPVYSGTSGTLLGDSLVLATHILQYPGTGTIGNLISVAGSGPPSAQDAGIVAANVVTGPGSAVTMNAAPKFANTAGTSLISAGYSADTVVRGPASSVTGNLAWFTDTGGKNIGDSGVAFGALTDIPFAASNFTAAGGGTFTASSTDFNSYYKIGRFVHWTLRVTGTVAGTVTQISVNISSGTPMRGAIGTLYLSVAYTIAGTANPITYIGAGGTVAACVLSPAAPAFPTGSFVLMFSVSYLI
jgi:hypothetical protein